MATYRVGDRVRFARAETSDGKRVEGRAGIVTKIGAFPCLNRDTGARCVAQCLIRIDGENFERQVDFWQLEPLTPPKQQEVVSWDECEFTRDGQYRPRVAA